MRVIGRILGVLLSAAVVIAGGLAVVYYSGMSFPVQQDTITLGFKNWNKTGKFRAEMVYQAGVARQSDRLRADVVLRVPGASQHLQSFLDGGRERIVRCGPQDLYLHRLVDAKLAIEDKDIAVSGHADLELDGLVKAHDDLPIEATVAFGHSETELWLDLTGLRISSLPDPMTEALVRDIARIGTTRERVLERVIRKLPKSIRPILRAHVDELDLRFERLVPTLQGDTLTIEAEVSVSESAVAEVLSEVVQQASAGPGKVVAELFLPTPARADFFKELKKIGKQLEGAGQQVEQELKKSGDPVKAIAELINQSGVCKTAF